MKFLRFPPPNALLGNKTIPLPIQHVKVNKNILHIRIIYKNEYEAHLASESIMSGKATLVTQPKHQRMDMPRPCALTLEELS